MLLRKFMSAIRHILHNIKTFLKVLFKINNPFLVRNISDAKKVILTPFAFFSSDDRWESETEYELSELRKHIRDYYIICDFGIGIGRISKEILREFQNVNIVGIDSSPQMLNLCKQRIDSIYYDRLQLLLFKKVQTVKTASIDFAFSIYTLQHIPTNLFERALMELRRVIKPEGLLYLLNMYDRCVIDGGKKKQYFDDGIRQLDVISKYFEEVQDVKYESEHMREILKTHFSKLFRPK